MPARTIPYVVAAALFMEGMDTTIVTVALPTIARDLGIDAISLKLAITSYLVGLAIVLPISGWVADRLGARTTFCSAIGLYLAASIGCALSGTVEGFVAWRFLQGIGGALMTPVGRMVIVRSVPKSELIAALATLTVPALFGPILGPLVGGLIVTYTDWRFIFLVNVPFGLAGIVLAMIYFDDVRPPPTPLDWTGFALSAIGLAALIAGATAVGRAIVPGWAVALAFAVAALAAVLYVRHSRRVAVPLLDVRLFAFATFDAGVTGGALFRIAIGAAGFLLPLMLQLGLGLDPLTAGILTLLTAIGALVMKFAGPFILRRFGFRPVLIVNAVLAIGSVALLAAIGPATPLVLIALLVFVSGLTRSLQFTSMHAVTYAEVAPHQAGAASTIASVAQQVSTALGVTIGALALEISQASAGRSSPAAADFAVALLTVSVIAITCVVKMRALPADAGRELNGG